MDAIPLPLGGLTCFFVRHGERVDHIDDSWAQTAPEPYDPPLTRDGHEQALRTGALIYSLEQQALQQQGPGPPPQTTYRVITSPFLRCAQTAEGLFRGFQQEEQASQGTGVVATGPWTVAVEPGLSEVMNENYFAHPPPETIITRRRSDLASGAVHCSMRHDDAYVPARDCLPEYPEGFQSMLARFVSTLDYTTSALVEQPARQEAGAGVADCSGVRPSPRSVVILVTHGAGVSALLWATTLKPGFNDVPYCCLTRARIVSRRKSQPLQPFGTSRIPAYTWDVDYRAYASHINPRL
ncbi:hypothetical protein LPJ61_005630 [Coemansia biformis]|uniref:Phosphoglycerate mutase-like protein n=1 Tax=Coemansia biformis TaxID=1286918 RepID=A0A9W7Y8B6_9FUNG|nr:hypothetical protein LPJ61_005630 [Coemansia biformis]